MGLMLIISHQQRRRYIIQASEQQVSYPWEGMCMWHCWETVGNGFTKEKRIQHFQMIISTFDQLFCLFT